MDFKDKKHTKTFNSKAGFNDYFFFFSQVGFAFSPRIKTWHF